MKTLKAEFIVICYQL